MRPRLIFVSDDITTTTSPVLMGKLRGKGAREIYRCCKGIVLSGSMVKPICFALTNIPLEFSKGIIYSSVGDLGEAALGYISGVGVVRYVYKTAQPGKLKEVARLCYNGVCLPMTIYSKGISEAFNLVGVSKLEEIWFGSPVYIFDDNRLWLEKNYTVDDLVSAVAND